eukprot:gene3524-4437_t
MFAIEVAARNGTDPLSDVRVVLLDDAGQVAATYECPRFLLARACDYLRDLFAAFPDECVLNLPQINVCDFEELL